ncbi:hypothetical protein [Rubellicoccus peritrichatus]|uniref:Uncharacterized protein n=1 Tax=Rubellicoccus peritrichatus TaxID=3080537 RepID=A0AAQ3L967_9BACT|nr:hypothetical protein [Puniceicoccus sp. CR14]WOO41675.1 hypothetical protein RZN69_01145 [Puniceicoccus sp. CR14]
MGLPPPIQPTDSKRASDAEHLKLLAIFHYILGALSLCSILFILLHYMLFSTFFNNPDFFPEGEKPPEMPEGFFILIMAFYVLGALFSIVSGGLLIASARFIQKRKNRTFSIIVAGLCCLMFPFGTILGVFTLMKLLSDSVKIAYTESESTGVA